MKFTLDMGAWSSVFAVPTSIVDKHIKLAGENELKVMLWLLRHGGLSVTSKILSEKISISENAINDAVEYWVQVGLVVNESGKLKYDDKNVTTITNPSPTTQDIAPKEDVSAKRMLRPNSQQIATRLMQNKLLSDLLSGVEASLGKTLSPSLSAVIINAHDDYMLPPEVIYMIVNYAKSIHKTSTNYIEALTKSWSNEQIFSLELAESKLLQLDARNRAWKKVSSILELPHRSPSKNETDTAYRWCEEMFISPEIIREAYERCIDKIGKYNIKYMNAIIENFHKLSINSLKDLQAYENSQNENTPTETGNGFDKFDLFNMMEKKNGI